MRCIRLQTVMVAPIGACFDLSLSVDAHTASMRRSGEHTFTPVANGETVMTDVVQFQSPLGALGTLVDRLILDHYMRHLLRERNAWLKATVETRT